MNLKFRDPWLRNCQFLSVFFCSFQKDIKIIHVWTVLRMSCNLTLISISLSNCLETSIWIENGSKAHFFRMLVEYTIVIFVVQFYLKVVTHEFTVHTLDFFVIKSNTYSTGAFFFHGTAYSRNFLTLLKYDTISDVLKMTILRPFMVQNEYFTRGHFNPKNLGTLRFWSIV